MSIRLSESEATVLRVVHAWQFERPIRLQSVPGYVVKAELDSPHGGKTEADLDALVSANMLTTTQGMCGGAWALPDGRELRATLYENGVDVHIRSSGAHEWREVYSWRRRVDAIELPACYALTPVGMEAVRAQSEVDHGHGPPPRGDAPKPKRRKRGAKGYPPEIRKKDAELLDMWDSGSYGNFADLARETSLKPEQVKLAIDREKKRRR